MGQGGPPKVPLAEFARVHGPPHAASAARARAALPPEVRLLTPRSALLLQFDPATTLPCRSTSTVWWPAGVAWFHAALLDGGCDAKYASKAWVANHFRWIVWKLGSMERAFPHAFAGKALTSVQVLRQLQLRYQREHVVRFGCSRGVVWWATTELTVRCACA